jgi:DNA-binding response OmpR family regulator
VDRHRILVVEDDPLIGPLIARYLEDAGYEATLTTDGTAAVAAARERTHSLVISDLVLRGSGDGREVTDAIAAIQPGVKVLLVSGFAASPYGADGTNPVLMKPFTGPALIALVEDLLCAG